MLEFLHSAWAYFTIMIIIFTVVYHMRGLIKPVRYSLAVDFRLALFTLVVTGIQIIIGFIYIFRSDLWNYFKEVDFSVAVKNEIWRIGILEHPSMSVIGFLLMLYGFRRMYYQPVSRRRFLSIVIFYTLGLIAILSRIPWYKWP